MNNDLLSFQSQLTDMADITVKLAGSGRAEFLYVHSSARAMEVSPDGSGAFDLEYWDHADEQSYVASVRTEEKVPRSEVVARVTEWLLGGS